MPKEGLRLALEVDYQRRYDAYNVNAVICIQVQRLALYAKLLLILIQFAGEVETRLVDYLDELEARYG